MTVRCAGLAAAGFRSTRLKLAYRRGVIIGHFHTMADTPSAQLGAETGLEGRVFGCSLFPIHNMAHIFPPTLGGISCAPLFPNGESARLSMLTLYT